jgi:hypothetical protein
MHHAPSGLRIEFFTRNSRPESGKKDEIVAERHAGRASGVSAHSPAKTAVNGAEHLVFPHFHLIDQRSYIAEHILTPHFYPVIYILSY